MQLLTIRADTEHGMGHVMRCKALAEAWAKAGGQVFWDTGNPHITEIDGWTVLDGYGYTEDDQMQVKSLGGKLLVIDDDVRLPRYHADLLLNYNAGAEQFSYNTDATTLLGLQYALIRKEYCDHPLYRTIPSIAKNVLVTFGGSDLAKQAIAKVQLALKGLPIDVRVPDGEVPMPELMAWADLCVCPASVTSYECAFMGVPMVLLNIAANHEPGAKVLIEQGAAVYGLPLDDVDEKTIRWIVQNQLTNQERRQAMSEAGRKLVDGEGARRVVEVMLGLTG